jgi:hypothetical protein
MERTERAPARRATRSNPRNAAQGSTLNLSLVNIVRLRRSRRQTCAVRSSARVSVLLLLEQKGRSEF